MKRPSTRRIALFVLNRDTTKERERSKVLSCEGDVESAA
jgi:hypothetical protein